MTLVGAARRAAFHRAAAALHRSLAGQGARGARHRPPVDLRVDHLDAARPRVRRHRRTRRFTATDIGKIVNRFLTKHFHKYVEYSFTADMEDELDAVSRGEEPWTTPLEKFWKPFIDQVEHIEKNVTREEVAHVARAGHRPGVAASPVSVRMGRFGPFVQIGTKDDVEKPQVRRPAPRPEDGHHHARRGDGAVPAAAQPGRRRPTARPITVAIGRFGPYVKYGASTSR